MNINKGVFLIVNSLIIALTVYFMGCISAQETATGKLAFQQKQFEKAEDQLTKGVAIDKDDMEAWYMLGVSRIEIGKYEEAKPCFEISKNAYGAERLSYWILKYNDGIDYYNAAVKSKKSKTQKDSTDAVGQFTKSLYDFKACSIIIPDSIISYQMMGDCYANLGKSDSALAIYTTILDKSKSKDDAINIARLMYQSGLTSIHAEQYDGALDIFKKVLNINYLPKDNIYYLGSEFYMGFVYYTVAGKNAKEGKEFKPQLQEVLKYLETLPASLSAEKDKDLLSTTYEILINTYEGLNMPDKADEIKAKKTALDEKK